MPFYYDTIAHVQVRKAIAEELMAKGEGDHIVIKPTSAEKKRQRQQQQKVTHENVQEELLENVSNSDSTTQEKPKATKRKKTLDPTGLMLAGMAGTGVKIGVDKLVTDPRKTITIEEASSIGQAGMRIADRHLGKYVKSYLPKGMKSDDLDDLKEIGAAVMNWFMRAALVTFQDYTLKKEQQIQQRKAAMEQASRSEMVANMPSMPNLHPQPIPPKQTSNSHNDVMMQSLDDLIMANGGTMELAS